MLGMVTPVSSMIFKQVCYLTFNPNQLLINSLKKRTSHPIQDCSLQLTTLLGRKALYNLYMYVLITKCQFLSLTFSFQLISFLLDSNPIPPSININAMNILFVDLSMCVISDLYRYTRIRVTLF